MLRLDAVDSYYRKIHALKGVSLRVRERSICCLIGANGAGKSTTLMAISGIQPISLRHYQVWRGPYSEVSSGRDSTARDSSGARGAPDLP